MEKQIEEQESPVSKERCHATKQRLLDASLDLLWTSSYGAVSVDDICREADVKKGSFYHFFPSKSELVVAALEDQWLERQDFYNDIFSPLVTPTERFRLLCRSTVKEQREQLNEAGHVCGCPFSSVGSEICSTDDAVRSKSVELIERTLTFFESALIEGQSRGEFSPFNPREKAEDLYNLLVGSMLQARIKNSLQPLERLEKTFCSMLGVE